jgi:hypothetical protein
VELFGSGKASFLFGICGFWFIIETNNCRMQISRGKTSDAP